MTYEDRICRSQTLFTHVALKYPYYGYDDINARLHEIMGETRTLEYRHANFKARLERFCDDRP